MAVTKTILDSKLVVVVETDETKNGKAVTKNISYSQLRTEATDEETLKAGSALAGLTSYGLDSVKRVDTFTLSEGE